jgi:hypothetical protein
MTSMLFVVASLLASVAWFALHDRGIASRFGTAVIVALPIGGSVHAFSRSAGRIGIVANLFALLIALVVAVLVTMSWPGPAV